MIRIELQQGTRSGYITEEQGKFRTENYRWTYRWTFSACNKEKDCLYDIYTAIDNRIVKVLATLTSTGKTKVCLVEDNFFEELEKEIIEIESKYYCHISFKEKEEWQ